MLVCPWCAGARVATPGCATAVPGLQRSIIEPVEECLVVQVWTRHDDDEGAVGHELQGEVHESDLPPLPLGIDGVEATASVVQQDEVADPRG